MLQIAFIVAFIISTAVVTYSVLSTINIRRKHPKLSIFSTLLYQQIFAFAFAMYGIWGFIFFKLIFSSELISKALVEKISNAQTLFAIPFQLFSWWFLIQLVAELVHFKKSRGLSLIFLLCIILIAFPVYLLFFNKTEAVHQCVFPMYSVLNGLIYVLISILFIAFNSSFLSQKRKFKLAILILFMGSFLSIGAYFYHSHILLTLLVILSFFIINLWPVALFQHFVVLPLEIIPDVEQNFKSLCNCFEISKREAEIIQLICLGYTNKAIADQLFISLQTVKDHTSRIYLKTEVKNRTQLANLFRK